MLVEIIRRVKIMDKCCHMVFKRAFEQLLHLLHHEKNITRERLIETLEYAISEIDKTEKFNE